MEGKKISFGFMKTKKQEKPIAVEKKEYIECVEEKSIKIVGGELIKEEKPLIIPMKPNTLITAERLKEIAEKVENFEEPILKKEDENTKEKNVKNESLDQMAVRELLEDAKNVKVEEAAKLVVPINSLPVIEGKTESTLDDYESVPVQEFGMAMLRGMGWTPSKESTYKQPPLRPKGLGLGADKIIKENKKNQSSKEKEEELSIVKNSFVRITSGKHSGYYGKVISLDEDNGRVMIDITIKKESVSLSEFMVQPVTKSEFDKQSKVINSESYEEYKKNEYTSNSRKQSSDKVGTSSNKVDDRLEEKNQDEERYSNGKSLERNQERRPYKDSSSEEERSKHRKKHKKKYSSNDSLSSDSDSKQPSRRRHSTSSSSSSDKRRHKSKKSKAKRDIDKKRKGKKKKRDRDRSPNYKKHRK